MRIFQQLLRTRAVSSQKNAFVPFSPKTRYSRAFSSQTQCSAITQKDASSAYISSVNITSVKLVGAFGLSAAIATPICTLGLTIISSTFRLSEEFAAPIGAGIFVGLIGACGLISCRLLSTVDTKHPAPPTTIIDAEQKIYSCTIPRGRMLSAYGIMTCLGAFLSPFIWVVVFAVNPAIVPIAVPLAAGCYAGALALNFPFSEDRVAALFATSLFYISFVPGHSLQIDTVLTSLLFTAFMTIDTQAAIRSYHDIELDPVGCGAMHAINGISAFTVFVLTMC